MRVSVDDPGRDADVNVRGTAEVLEAARALDARVVFSSTGGAIYGEVDDDPLARVDAVRGDGAVRHLQALRRALRRALQPPLRRRATSSCATATCTGRARTRTARPAWSRSSSASCVEGTTPLVFGDGTQTRDYVYVGDVVAANLAALGYGGAHTIFNIGTATETSVIDLLAECQRAAGTDVAPELRPARLGELARSALDPSLAERELGWRAGHAARRRPRRDPPLDRPLERDPAPRAGFGSPSDPAYENTSPRPVVPTRCRGSAGDRPTRCRNGSGREHTHELSLLRTRRNQGRRHPRGGQGRHPAAARVPPVRPAHDHVRARRAGLAARGQARRHAAAVRPREAAWPASPARA